MGSWPSRHDPDRVALIDDARTVTYGELDSRSARLAGVLAAGGIRRGDRVAILLGNHSTYLETVFACGRIGAIAVPVNNRLSPREIAVQVDDCAPRGLVAEPELRDRVAQPPAFTLTSDRWEATLEGAEPHPVTPVGPDEALILMYTSGTTGVPKGALLPQRKALYNARNAEIFFELTPDDRVLIALPLFHSFGLAILALPTLYCGGQIVLHQRFDPEKMWADCVKHGITFFGAVPTMFQRLLDAFPPERPPCLRFLFTAGAPIPVEVIRSYESRGVLMKQGFGQTETSILCALDTSDALRKAGSVGKPVRHGEIRCVDPDTWRDVPPGVQGEIVVRGPITMLGYWNRPEESTSAFHAGWLRTGDLAKVDDEGFYHLVGRARDMFISGGENVYPAEVEAVYEEHPAISEIAVTGVPDQRWGEAGCAWIVVAPGAEADPEALRAWGSERLADFKIPKHFRVLPSLPRTVSGKVQKHRLGDGA